EDEPMMPKPPIRAALLVPLLSLGLLGSGLGVHLTRADTPPALCGLADVAEPATTADDTLLLLSAILPADADTALAAQPSRPNAPTPPNVPPPPGGVGMPKPPGTDLRAPEGAMLNLQPIVAARQFRESLSEKQKADLQAVVTKHQDVLQQARSHL